MLPSAWPRLHPNLPHLQKPAAIERSNTCTVERRLDEDNKRLTKGNDLVFESDNVSTFDELCDKLKHAAFPDGYVNVKGTDAFSFLFVGDIFGNPVHKASVIVNKELKLEIFLKRVRLPKIHVNHLLRSNGIVNSCSDLTNVLAHVKSLCENETSDHLTAVEVAADLLEAVVQDVDEHQQLVLFIITQLAAAVDGLFTTRTKIFE